MFAIRKFVGYTGAAAGIGAVLVLLMSSQTAFGAAASVDSPSQPAGVEFTPSGPCAAAIGAIKTWFANDAREDNSERMAVRTDPTAAETPGEDATEIADVRGLVATARTACAPAATSTTAPPTFTKPALSDACKSAIAALKAAWAAGRPTTQAQWQNVMTLAQKVRTVCGFTWSDAR